MQRSKEYSHYILTRYNTQQINGGYLYDDPVNADRWMDERMKLFEHTRASVLSQEGDFQWVISLDKRTPNRYVMDIITDPRMIVIDCDVRDTFKQIQVDTPWVITSRLDNDDLYLPGAIMAIQRCFAHKEEVIDLRYNQKCGDDRYGSGRVMPNSPFLSLVECVDKNIRTCFCRPHSKMPTEYNAIWADGGPFAYMVIHGKNVVNKITGKKI